MQLCCSRPIVRNKQEWKQYFFWGLLPEIITRNWVWRRLRFCFCMQMRWCAARRGSEAPLAAVWSLMARRGRACSAGRAWMHLSSAITSADRQNSECSRTGAQLHCASEQILGSSTLPVLVKYVPTPRHQNQFYKCVYDSSVKWVSVQQKSVFLKNMLRNCHCTPSSDNEIEVLSHIAHDWKKEK